MVTLQLLNLLFILGFDLLKDLCFSLSRHFHLVVFGFDFFLLIWNRLPLLVHSISHVLKLSIQICYSLLLNFQFLINCLGDRHCNLLLLLLGFQLRFQFFKLLLLTWCQILKVIFGDSLVINQSFELFNFVLFFFKSLLLKKSLLSFEIESLVNTLEFLAILFILSFTTF